MFREPATFTAHGNGWKELMTRYRWKFAKVRSRESTISRGSANPPSPRSSSVCNA